MQHFLFSTEEEPQSWATVPLQQVTYESLHLMGVQFENFQKHKLKKIIVECEHSEENDNTVNIKSKSWIKTCS